MSASAAISPSADRVWFAHYPERVPRTISVPDRRLPDLVGESAQRWRDRDAFIFYGSRWSYARFWDAAGRFAAALHREGFRPGDRLALYLPNCPAYPVAFFGALRLGVTVVQVSPLYLGQDLTQLLVDAQPKGVVTLEILAPNLAKVASQAPVPVTIVAPLRDFYPPLKRLFVNLVLRRRGLRTEVPSGPGIRHWKAFLAGESTFPAPTGDPSTEVAVLQYTGGTTGTAKAAMLTHRNLVANALQCQAWFRLQTPGSAVVMAAVPLFHVYGMTVAMNYPLLEGATIVLQARPDVNEVLKLIDRYHPTEFPGVPAFYQAINNHPKVRKYDIRSIKVCVSGSAPLPREVATRFEELTGGYLIEGYGLTEASPVTHANPIAGERRAGSIGLPVPGTDQRVADLADGTRPLPTGEAGELQVRGPQVMLGYYRQPEETRGVFVDGWLRTGDVATIDADGYAFIVDRKKDLIVVGGFNVYPREVEEVLYQHPGVQDAAVVGRPEAEHGEVVHAVVVRKKDSNVGESELIEFVRERIAHYKAPRSVEFRTELPRSAVQKVLRRLLREPASAGSPPTIPGPTSPAR